MQRNISLNYSSYGSRLRLAHSLNLNKYKLENHFYIHTLVNPEKNERWPKELFAVASYKTVTYKMNINSAILIWGLFCSSIQNYAEEDINTHQVEDEYHFIMECPLHSKVRTEFLSDIVNVCKYPQICGFALFHHAQIL